MALFTQPKFRWRRGGRRRRRQQGFIAMMALNIRTRADAAWSKTWTPPSPAGRRRRCLVRSTTSDMSTCTLASSTLMQGRSGPQTRLAAMRRPGLCAGQVHLDVRHRNSPITAGRGLEQSGVGIDTADVPDSSDRVPPKRGPIPQQHRLFSVQLFIRRHRFRVGRASIKARLVSRATEPLLHSTSDVVLPRLTLPAPASGKPWRGPSMACGLIRTDYGWPIQPWRRGRKRECRMHSAADHLAGLDDR